ncbi:MAG: hypothetical protein KAH09_09425, partial [Desulfobacula sp.]|nr:hypothetical protein [Desulfobacula sp.]
MDQISKTGIIPKDIKEIIFSFHGLIKRAIAMGYTRVRTIPNRIFADSILRFSDREFFFAGSPLNNLGKIKIQAINNTKTRISL